jgi:hypothetical protein
MAVLKAIGQFFYGLGPPVPMANNWPSAIGIIMPMADKWLDSIFFRRPLTGLTIGNHPTCLGRLNALRVFQSEASLWCACMDAQGA